MTAWREVAPSNSSQLDIMHPSSFRCQYATSGLLLSHPLARTNVLRLARCPHNSPAFLQPLRRHARIRSEFLTLHCSATGRVQASHYVNRPSHFAEEKFRCFPWHNFDASPNRNGRGKAPASPCCWHKTASAASCSFATAQTVTSQIRPRIPEIACCEPQILLRTA
jgi:hypothetical protein